MLESLKDNFRKFTQCSEDELIQFLDIIQPRLKNYQRKAFVLREGEVARDLYFIKEGCLRYFYVLEGEEKTGQFFFENGWYTDLESFLTQNPSQQYIQALEPSQLLLISNNHLEEGYQKVPIFERFGRKLVERAFLGIRAKNESLTHLSPEEHYLQLIAQRPKVIQRISLKYIASYIGVKPESLSRIRKRLFEQDSKT